MSVQVVASIGSSEPWNVAGLGLDVRALGECGARPVTIVAGVTAQGPDGVGARYPLPAGIIRAQFASLAAANVNAFRIGALLDADSAQTVASLLAGSAVPIVWDPAFASSRGGILTDPSEARAFGALLFPLHPVVTPNLAEAALLFGSDVNDEATMLAAARAFVAAGARAALVTGGHLPGAPVDVLFDGTVRRYEAPRIEGEMRGTGCLLAAALAAGLARGAALPEAVEAARAFVRVKLANAVERAGMRAAY